MPNYERAFHNDPILKARLVEEIGRHEAQDRIVPGTYGIPEWLAHLEHTIFMGLPKGSQQAKTFPRRFAEAIPVGADLEPVRHLFCSGLMRENIELVEGLDLPAELKKQVLAAIRDVLELHEQADHSEPWVAWSAMRAAEAAALSTRSGGQSAMWAAQPPEWQASRSAMWAATPPAGQAAAKAAESAGQAAAKAAESERAAAKAYERYADRLIDMLAAA